MKKRTSQRSNTTILHAGFGIVLLAFCLIPMLALGATRTWDGEGSDALASTAENWSDDTAPVADDDVVLDVTTNKNMTWDLDVSVASWTQDADYDGSVTFSTVYGATGFTNFTITGDCVISNGTWTHNGNSASEANRLRVTIGGNLVQGPAGSIDVSGKGYGSGKGPGAGTAGSYGGGGYNGGPTYGSVTSPTLGSDAGGGAIWLTVGGTATLDGTNVAKSVYAANYCGSGGGIYIAAGALEGGGIINANADGGTYGGGGGRIALVVTNAGADFSNFTGTITAYGDGNGTTRQGAGGTIYLERGDDDGKGELLVDQGGFGAQTGKYAGFDATGPCTNHFSRITCTNNGTISMDADDVLILTNTVLQGRVSDSDGILLSGGTLACPPNFAYSNFTLRIAATGVDFSPANSLTIETNGVLIIDKPHTMVCDVMIGPGGTITHTANGGSEAYKMDLTVHGSLTVEVGGLLSAEAKGYAANCGPGHYSTGASYGGIAYNSTPPYAYGSIVAPTNIGSGGSVHVGGGAILLAVSGAVTNNGTIIADGERSTSTGSGGTVNIVCGSLHGNGPITANGGYGNYCNGGGGRIALTVTNAGATFSTFDGDIQTYGGDYSKNDGGAGTIYLRLPGESLYEGTLIVDNGGSTYANETPISASVTDASVRDVIIRNGGNLSIYSNQSLRVSGVWSNAADYTGYGGGKVIFTGGSASTSTLYGATTFMDLVCTNAGKTLVFEAGETFTVDDLGLLQLTGSESGDVVLRSTSDTSAWYLNVSDSADQTVSYVDVWDSDADGGATIVAQDSEGLRTVNWVFSVAGQTNTWDGSSNTVWGVGDNWSLDHAPTADDVVVIPGGAPRYPVLDASKTLARLTVETGASLTLGGYDLTVVTNAVFAGHLIASSTETITFQADLDFSGGAFTAARSTVVFDAGQAQSFDPDELTFYKVSVTNSAGTLTFTDGLTATELRCDLPSGTRGLVFTAGETYTTRQFVMLGAVGDTNITLRSSAEGSAWDLDVTGYSYVRGVDVKDSNANPGRTVYPLACQDSGSNPNWDFSHTWATWLGTTSADFDTAANWSPASVPDADTCVLIDSLNPMEISSDTTVFQLRVGGSVGSTVTVDSALCVVEDITVLDGGELEINTSSVVSNDVFVMAGGSMTHAENGSTAPNTLILRIAGDLILDYDSAIDCTGKGYATGNGPGAGSGASYGGTGNAGVMPYGSIVAPTNCGSGGINGTKTGGGSVLLTVAGAVENNGEVLADGGVPSTSYTGPAGGSINVVCGTLTGTGAFSAKGPYTYGSGGGGGRIALKLTGTGADFSAFTGDVLVYGDGDSGGAGTLYRQTAAELSGWGTVTLDNNGRTDGYTDFPPASYYETGEVDHASFVVTNGAILRLTNDFTVGDIYLTSANATLDLNSLTLTVRSVEHALGSGTVSNYGQILWVPVGGSMFMFR